MDQTSSDNWINELRAGRANEALDRLQQEPETPSKFISLGAAYMWTGNYQSALDHFKKQIQAARPSNPPSDLSFGMSASAAWCLGNRKLAIKYWREGTKVGYAVGGANTRTSLLLYAAAILDPAVFSMRAAEQLLKKKEVHWRVKNWPGPLAQFVLGTVTEETARNRAVYQSPNMRSFRKTPMLWQLEFYKLLKTIAAMNVEPSTVRKRFQDLLEVRGSEYLDGLNFFYFLRLEEFYIARHSSLLVRCEGS